MIPFIDGPTLRQLLSSIDAINALESALRSGLDPRRTASRMATGLANGELLTMPAESDTGVGVKLITIAGTAPAGVEARTPRIQGIFVLFDSRTLTPVALYDGPSLTTLRTAAHSALAIRYLAPPDAARLVVFGTGPQARAHIEAVTAVRPITAVTVVGRRPQQVEELIATIAHGGFSIESGSSDAVQRADIIVCATTSRRPLFPGASIGDRTCVVAIGSHEPEARELDDDVMRRASRVVVEDRVTAMREAGDVIQAVQSGALAENELVEIADAISLEPADGVTVFKGVGSGWQDLAVAEAAQRRM